MADSSTAAATRPISALVVVGIDEISEHTVSEDELLPICFQAKRHLDPIEGIDHEKDSWRIRERMKTVSVALVLCLNIGVDPPDIVKTQPCARLECWIDPSTVSAPKAMELIGANLQKQYEHWQPRARYKKFHDPTMEDVKKLCTSLRRNAKDERVLFHYNGHGVPRPTTNGEIWVFNKTYTQYIPLSIYDLQAWMGAPSIYVYDCSNAGIIVNSFNQFAEQHEREMLKAMGSNTSSNYQPVSYKNCIQLAACSAKQILPMNAQLPADLFTACLTTPIRTALKWYTMPKKSHLIPDIRSELIERMPGQTTDRRTMLGELNWIFTAITDTIAWNTLDRDLFQKLFRQDLLVASLFRNYLLAERILRSHDCTPVSSPALPQCFRHPMWNAWDLSVDLALQQLPGILEQGAPYKQLPFFEEQLTAFQVWLDRESEKRTPPEQLPIVLQVLLSQVHRLRALELLARFLDLGPWAVDLALGVGIFPYVLKLLQSSAKELRPMLVFIWAKILAVDGTCQKELEKEHRYFLSVLQDTTTLQKEQRILSAFVLSTIVQKFPTGQMSALQGSLVSICLFQLNDDNWLLRQWLVICLGQLWQNFAKARWSGVRDLAHEKLYALLLDPVPEVRAAAVFALGTFISSVTDRSEDHANKIDRIIAITLLDCVGDMSPLVRLELVASLQWMVILFESHFVSVYLQESATTASPPTGSHHPHYHPHHAAAAPYGTHSLERNVNMKRGYSSSCIAIIAGGGGSATNAGTSSAAGTTAIPFGSIFLKLWQGIGTLCNDPFPKVAEAAAILVEFVRNAALTMITAKEATTEKFGSSSLSLPPSPNSRSTCLGGVGESDSDLGPYSLNMSSASALVCGSAGKKSTMANISRILGTAAAAVGASQQTERVRMASLNDTSTTSSSRLLHDDSAATADSFSMRSKKDGIAAAAKPLVTTNFIPWAISYFARPGQSRGAPCDHQVVPGCIDKHSKECITRQWRMKRNETIRRQAQEQRYRTSSSAARCFNTQHWIRMASHTLSLVKMMPYESKICVAEADLVTVHDLTRNNVCSYGPPRGRRQQPVPSSRVTALEFVNAHDASMLLVGHRDGMIRLWQQPTEPQQEKRLVTAWEGFPYAGGNSRDESERKIAQKENTIKTLFRHKKSKKRKKKKKKFRPKKDAINYGIVTSWQQKSQHLIVGGETRYLRIWDAQSELKLCDLPTNTESYVRSLSSSSNDNLIAAGCSDGSVRIFDKRCPSTYAGIRTLRDDSDVILMATLHDKYRLVTGCVDGNIRIYDIRYQSGAQSNIRRWKSALSSVNAMAVHPTAEIIACGAQSMSIYDFAGRSQLRNNEATMSLKSQLTCLSFHPYKITLSAGFSDLSMCIYEALEKAERQSDGILQYIL